MMRKKLAAIVVVTQLTMRYTYLSLSPKDKSQPGMQLQRRYVDRVGLECFASERRSYVNAADKLRHAWAVYGETVVARCGAVVLLFRVYVQTGTNESVYARRTVQGSAVLEPDLT